MRKLRKPYGHEQFLPYLTQEEREEYTKARDLVHWLRGRMVDPQNTMDRLELAGRRRGEARQEVREAAE